METAIEAKARCDRRILPEFNLIVDFLTS